MHWSSSGGIIDTLNGLLEKGETQLNTATETETTNKNNFDQLKQSLTDEIKFANKDMDDAKKGLAESAEIKAAAEGDLDVTTDVTTVRLRAAPEADWAGTYGVAHAGNGVSVPFVTQGFYSVKHRVQFVADAPEGDLFRC